MMKPLIICAFLSLYIFSTPATSQKVAFLEIEAGTNVSSMPHRRPLANGIETTLPVVSPLIGVWLTPWPNRRFTISAGVQAFSRGQYYSHKYHGTDLTEYSLLYHPSFDYTQTEDMKFQAISPAINTTFSFFIKKVKAGVSIGYRLLNYTTGNYLYTSRASYQPDVGQDTYYEIGFNPFSDAMYMPGKRMQSQISVGFRFALTSRCSLHTTYSTGGRLEFMQVQPIGGCATGLIHGYQRGDIGLSLLYRI